MEPLFLDFETYWSDDYSLKKMTPVEYIQDPRFEALVCSFVNGDGTSREWVDGPDLPAKFASIPWDSTYLVSHNALFDALILSFRYGIYPKMYGCTLSMARNWISHMTGSVSLEACAKFFGMPPKWQTVSKTKGVSFEMLKSMPELHRETGDYAVDDAEKCRQIFIRIMADGFPRRELDVINMVVRMAARPAFTLDQTALAEHLANVRREKQELLEKAQLVRSDPGKEELDGARSNLLSDNIFAGMLLNLGVIPPMKKSKANPDKEAYAFAKTDKEFTALAEHPNPMVQTLVAARLGHKSTLEETRSERLLAISKIVELAPVPLKYSGAHTHRFSGDWKINLQNLLRGGKLRYAMKAPKGKKVVSVDASQIEARFNAVLSQQWDLVDQFRRGIDVYADFASSIYQHPVSKDSHPKQRFVGKTGVLSLGYGASPPVFQNMCRVQGGVQLTDSEATSVVYLYRQRYKQIVANWDYADRIVLPMMAGLTPDAQRLIQGTDPASWSAWGPVGIMKNALLLPSGNRLRYRDLHQEPMPNGRAQWIYMRGPMFHHVYGAKLVENGIQALAFAHIIEVALRVVRLTNGFLWPAHQVHDELIYIVDDAIAEKVRDLVTHEMAVPPEWMQNAPLAAEGHIGQSYGDVK